MSEGEYENDSQWIGFRGFSGGLKGGGVYKAL